MSVVGSLSLAILRFPATELGFGNKPFDSLFERPLPVAVILPGAAFLDQIRYGASGIALEVGSCFDLRPIQDLLIVSNAVEQVLTDGRYAELELRGDFFV
jgi:hypothetical protein